MALILVIDDSEIVPKMLARILKRHGNHQVLTASNGKEGLEISMSNDDISLIFLDLTMPVMDGFEFIEKFRNSGLGIADIPIVVLTSRDQTDISRAIEQGATSYLNKPLQLKELGVVVANILSGRT